MTRDERIEWIDNASYRELLSKSRFAPAGDPFFAGNIGDYYGKVMEKRRDDDPAAAVAASKSIGWDR